MEELRLNSHEEYVLGLVKRLVPVSDFSKGRTAKIFEDIKKNNHEYIVLKNNQPTAVLLSLEAYSEMVYKVRKIESMLTRIEDNRLVKKAQRVSENFDYSGAASFQEVLALLGLTEVEVEELAESVVVG